MKLLISINRVSYIVCLLSIVVWVFLAIISIWVDEYDFLWKEIQTAGVLNGGSLLVLIINRLISTKMVSKSGGFGAFISNSAWAVPIDSKGTLSEPGHAQRSAKDESLDA